MKAALIGSGGVKFMDGNELRMKLGLNSTWAVFTSMSISPAARDHASISRRRAASPSRAASTRRWPPERP